MTRTGTSLIRLFAVSLVWIAIFFGLYFALFKLHPKLRNDIQKPAMLAAGHALFTFIELQPGLSEAEDLKNEHQEEQGEGAAPAAGGQTDGQAVARAASQPSPSAATFTHNEWLIAYWALLISELIVAYVHLGLFVSVMYRRITKRAP